MITREVASLPPSWKWTKIGNVCLLEKNTLDPQEYPSEIFAHYSIPSFDEGQQPVIELGSEIHSSKILFSTGVVLFSKLNPRISRVWAVNDEIDYRRVCSTEFLPLRPDEAQVSIQYLKYVLQERTLIDRLRSQVQAATKSRERLNPRVVLASPIPIPPLDEQRRIAAILERADRVRRLCRYALDLGESYLQAVFLEMFGDPVTNPMGWDIRRLGDVIEAFEGGVNFPPVANGEAASEWRVLKVSAATWGNFNPEESKPISPDVEFEDTFIVRWGDLIFSRANTTELVGAVCLVREHPPKVLLPDKLWRIKLKPDSLVLPEYVLYALRQPFIRRRIGILATGTSGSMKNISKAKTATLPILLPPIDYQGRFAEVVRQFEHIRAQQREQLRQAEHLFASLLDRAFRGEVQ